MQGPAEQAAVLRIITVDGCEVSSCYQLAAWVVTFKDETYRLCSKHTMIKMRDASIWEDTAEGKIESSTD
ncbi:MAG TPA: hypothetical protein VGR56_03480 [Nitrososphaerales archaeon]|nr:hypothetical protein [Nitrososphaerales archaeon]